MRWIFLSIFVIIFVIFVIIFVGYRKVFGFFGGAK